MPDLPPLNIVVTRVELPDAVMATYQTLQRELFAALEERTIEASSPLVATGKCAQLANGFLYDEGNEDPVEVHTVKIDWLRELVNSMGGAPLLVTYEFLEDLRAIRRAFGEVPALGGLIPASEATRLVDAWNAGALPLLAFHPASAGHEINLHDSAERIWPGSRQAGRRNSPSRRSRGSTGPGRPSASPFTFASPPAPSTR